jgi:hypothetical protein
LYGHKLCSSLVNAFKWESFTSLETDLLRIFSTDIDGIKLAVVVMCFTALISEVLLCIDCHAYNFCNLLLNVEFGLISIEQIIKFTSLQLPHSLLYNSC